MRFQFPILSLLLIGLAACGTEAKLVTSITVKSTSDSIITKGGTLQMAAQIEPADAEIRTVLWAVNNTQGAATISTDGLLTAGGDGDRRASCRERV